jgi:hypothetical protein
MDYQTLFVALLSVSTAILGWFAREMWAAVKALETNLSNFKEKIANEYVRYDRLKDAMEPIMDALAEIKETLKTKADK